jgi:hypothetical protein
MSSLVVCLVTVTLALPDFQDFFSFRIPNWVPKKNSTGFQRILEDSGL